MEESGPFGDTPLSETDSVRTCCFHATMTSSSAYAASWIIYRIHHDVE